MASKHYKIAAIPGDGIGGEVLPVGQTIVDRVAALCDFTVSWQTFDWSCQRYCLLYTSPSPRDS